MDTFKKMIMYCTLQEREKRTYKLYEKNRKYLEALSSWQLHERYISLKSKYEFKKSFSAFLVVTLFLSILGGVWKTFYVLFQKTLTLFLNQENSITTTKVILLISTYILVVLVIVMFICIFLYLKNLYGIYEQLLLIEEIRCEKNKHDSED